MHSPSKIQSLSDEKPMFEPEMKLKEYTGNVIPESSFETETKPGLSENDEYVMPKPLDRLNGIQIPPFLSKTYDLVDDPCLDHIISWGSNGVSFLVWDTLDFSRIVLPRNFKHNNFSSFVRQLNTYGFRKIDTDKWEFANEGFIRGKRHLLKSIQRRRSTQTQPIWSSSELGNDELQSELEKLKKDKNLMQREVMELQKQQHGNALQMKAVNEQLNIAEQRQKKMGSFLAKLLQNGEFLARLRLKKEQRAITTQKNTKMFLKHQNEPDTENISKISEFNPSDAEGITRLLLENKVDDIGFNPDFVPCGIESSRLDKGKNLARPQVEADHKHFVSFPEEPEREENMAEVPSLEIGSVVKQEDLWNLGFEDAASMPCSSTNLLGNFSNYDDVAGLGLDGSLSDLWDLGSWPADDDLSNELGGPSNMEI